MRKIVAFLTALFSSAIVAQAQVDFRVVVPDSWSLVAYDENERLWSYQSQDGNHRLSVSILYYSSEPSHEQQVAFLRDFLKVRQEQSSNLLSGLEFGETEMQEYEQAWVAKFREQSVKNRFATNKAISTRIGIANFYLESFSSKEEHEEIGEKILATTGFAS